jgi:hypothetical protein
MKRESRLLLAEAKDALVLAIEIYNRPSDVGRKTSTLILLDHAFEMLLKAGILHRGGKIRRPREANTLSFDESVRKALSDGTLKFIDEEQALVLQTTNLLRDAGYHHLVDISEQQLYIQAQASLTLFRDIMKAVFAQDLYSDLPTRVLPLSTSPPTDLAALFDHEVSEIRRLMEAGKRRRTEASAKARALAITENALAGSRSLPTDADIHRLLRQVKAGMEWTTLFPGVASIEVTTTGTGPTLSIRWTKREGVPIHTVQEGTPRASVVAVRRVNELDFWNMSHGDLSRQIGLTGPRTTALIRHLCLQEDQDCFKRIEIGRSTFDRYSQRAIERCKGALQVVDMDEVWRQNGPRRRTETQ